MSGNKRKSNLSGKMEKTTLKHGVSSSSDVMDDHHHNDGGSELASASEAASSPAEETLDQTLLFKKRSTVPNSEAGCSSKVNSSKKKLGLPSHSEGQPPSTIKANHAKPLQQREFLFKKTLKLEDMHLLHIPFVMAKRHFPSLERRRDGTYQECLLDIMDHEESTWKMNFTRSGCNHRLTWSWKDFVENHGLKTDDMIWFFKSKQHPGDKQYIIEFRRQGEASMKDDQDDDAGMQLGSTSGVLSVHSEEVLDRTPKACKEGNTSKRKIEDGSALEMHGVEASHGTMLNSKSGCLSEIRNDDRKLELPSHCKQQRVLLFDKILSWSEIHTSLRIPKEDAEKYFPTLHRVAGKYTEELIYVTDHRGKTWEMTFKKWLGLYELGTMAQWSSFVKNHQLQPHDMIRFYKANNASQGNKYFFVEVRRQRRAQSAKSQMNKGSKTDSNNNSGGASNQFKLFGVEIDIEQKINGDQGNGKGKRIVEDSRNGDDHK